MERTTDANEEISPEEVRNAVRQVLTYLHEDERRHYESGGANERNGHVFESLERLRRWLDATSSRDDVDELRRNRLQAINAQAGSREALEAAHGQVWNTQELKRDFAVVGFMAPYVVVCRKSERQQGSLEFQHEPRFYFNFQPD